MPGESSVFITRVDPVSPPKEPVRKPEIVGGGAGYRPGSAMLIPQAVYRHSRLLDSPNIGACRLWKKREELAQSLAVSVLRDNLWRNSVFAP